MNNKRNHRQSRRRLVAIRNCLLLLGTALTSGVAISPMLAQSLKPKSYDVKSVTTSPGYGYTQVGDTRIYYNQESNFDIIGRFQNNYYGSTFSNRGYSVALKVNEGSAHILSSYGETVDGVAYRAWIEPQGELARVCYEFTNLNDSTITVSAGTHADVMIGNNDRAPITRRIDSMGNTYGVTMSDGGGAQLCVLFGMGLKGVTSVSDFWFGYYGENSSANQMVGNYYHGSNWMQENGNYDSGMGWCWKNHRIAPGESLVLSYLIGVGEVNLQPSSNVEVTPEDPDGWNDLSRPHRLTLAGTYDSPAGLDGSIEYAVEDSEEWHLLTDTISSGTEFSQSIVVNFIEGRPLHTIRLRTVDAVGNTTSMPSIEYVDIASHEFSGTRNYVYSGDSIYQSDITSDLPTEQFALKNYRNNLNAGLASYNVEGVFPYTIGRRTYQFEISPQPLRGELLMADTTYVYNGQPITPKWQFSEAAYASLIEEKDYIKQLTDTMLPGVATLTVRGCGNYTSTLTAHFDIDKAPLRDNLYHITLPASDITYDGQPHTATATQAEGVGSIRFTYATTDGEEVEAPTNAGSYSVYAEVGEGSLYYGCPRFNLGTFTIYGMDAQEWQALMLLNQQFAAMSGTPVWDMSQGIKGASSLSGLSIVEGHVKMLNLSNCHLTGALPQALYALSQVETLDLSHNRLTGNVGLLGQTMKKLRTLNVADNAFSDLYPMLPTTITSLNIGQQHIDKTIEIDGSTFDVASIVPQLPTILAYNHAEQKYDTNLALAITTAPTIAAMNQENVWTIFARLENGQISIPYVSSANVYHGESGDTLKAFKLTLNLGAEGSVCKVKYVFERGDCNFKPGVDATDLQATILYIFGSYGRNPFNHTAADTYKDGTINVQDVVATVNILLSQQPNSSALANAKAQIRVASQADAEAFVYLHDGKVWLYSERPVATLSIQAFGNIDWNLRAHGLQQSILNANLVAYSLNNVELPVGQPVELGSYSGTAHLLSASLSDAQALSITSMLSDVAITGITEVSANGSIGTDAEVYNLQGIKTSGLQKGVNLIKEKGKVKKVIVK